jgi:hypothetical protein
MWSISKQVLHFRSTNKSTSVQVCRYSCGSSVDPCQYPCSFGVEIGEGAISASSFPPIPNFSVHFCASHRLHEKCLWMNLRNCSIAAFIVIARLANLYAVARCSDRRLHSTSLSENSQCYDCLANTRQRNLSTAELVARMDCSGSREVRTCSAVEVFGLL